MRSQGALLPPLREADAEIAVRPPRVHGPLTPPAGPSESGGQLPHSWAGDSGTYARVSQWTLETKALGSGGGRERGPP